MRANPYLYHQSELRLDLDEDLAGHVIVLDLDVLLVGKVFNVVCVSERNHRTVAAETIASGGRESELVRINLDELLISFFFHLKYFCLVSLYSLAPDNLPPQ